MCELSIDDIYAIRRADSEATKNMTALEKIAWTKAKAAPTIELANKLKVAQ